MKNTNSSKISSYLIIIMSLFMLGYSFVKQVDVSNKEKTIPEQVQQQVKIALEEAQKKPSEFPDYSSLKDLKSLTLATNFESWTPRSQKDVTKVVQTVVIDKGSLAKAYVYIKASMNEKALTQWESIYMSMNYRGGHIFRPQSLPVPQGDRTELLYALNDIPYLNTIPYNEQSIPARTNWFSLFTNGNRIRIETFISSLRPAKLDEFSLYYSCEVNSDCQLSVTQ